MLCSKNECKEILNNIDNIDLQKQLMKCNKCTDKIGYTNISKKGEIAHNTRNEIAKLWQKTYWSSNC